MEYTDQDYQADLNDSSMPHIESRERFSSFYNKLGEGPAQSVEYPKHRMDWVDIDHPSNILELGCHNGYNLIYWAAQDPDTTCVGVDISTPLLRKARERIHEAGVGDRVVVFDSYIEDFQSPPDITDIVLTETLEHVQDAQAVLNAVEPMVEPGVNLWITVPSRRWGNSSHVRGIRAATLASMLQDAGFDVADIQLIDERRVQGENLTRCLVKRQF